MTTDPQITMPIPPAPVHPAAVQPAAPEPTSEAVKPRGATTPRGTRPYPLAYLAVWAALMGTASTYLVAVALVPETVAEILPPVRTVESQDADVRRDIALAEAARLRDELEETRRELIQLRSEPQPPPDAAPLATGTVVAPELVLPDLLAAKPGSERTGRTAPGVVAPVVGARQSAIQTGSVPMPARPPVLPPPASKVAFTATVEPALPSGPLAGPLGLTLASGPSVDSLRLSWSLLSERHGALLKPLQARYVASGEPSGAAFDLVAGPFSTPEEANRVCGDLKTKRVACRVGAFAGNAL